MARRPSKSDYANPVPSSSFDERHYRAKDALSTLKRAEEIKSDKGLMRDVQKCIREDQKALSKVAKVKR